MFGDIKYSKDRVLEVLLLIITLLFATTFTSQVIFGILTGRTQQTFPIANAALVSLVVISGVCFAYSALIAEDEKLRLSVTEIGLKLLYSSVLVVIAVGIEWFARLYLVPPFSNFAWIYWPVLFGLAVINTLFFWRALTYAYKGTMELKDTLWQLLTSYRAKSN